MRRDHRFERRERQRIDELALEQLIVPARAAHEPLYESVLACFTDAHVKPNIIYGTTQSQVGISLADRGLGSAGAAYVFASTPQSLVYSPVDGFDPLPADMLSRQGERHPLVPDLIEPAIDKAHRAQLNSCAALQRGTAD
jgi:hypothetical protein